MSDTATLTKPELDEQDYLARRATLVGASDTLVQEHAKTAFAHAIGEAKDDDLAAARRAIQNNADAIEGLDAAWEVSLRGRAERRAVELERRREEAGKCAHTLIADRLSAANAAQKATLALAASYREFRATEEALGDHLAPWIRNERAASTINTLLRQHGLESHVAGLLQGAGMDVSRWDGPSSAQTHQQDPEGIVATVSDTSNRLLAHVGQHLPLNQDGN